MTSGPARSHGDTLLDRWGDKASWTLPRLLHRQAYTAGDRPFLRVGSQPSLTFRETYDEAAAMAGRLRELGVERGDYVVLMSRTSMPSVFTWFGANLLGAIEVPLNSAYRGRPLIHGINLTQARTMVVASEFLPVIREVASQLEHLETILCLDEPSEQATIPGIEIVTMGAMPSATSPSEDEILTGTSYRDTASVLFTSGTTGPAKGVILPHAHVCTFAHSGVDMFDLRETDTIYCFHTLFHATKFLAVVGALVSGCQVTLDTFDPQTWLKRLRDSEGTVTIAHGPMLEMILAQSEGQNDADNPLRIAMGAGVSPSLAEEFQRRFDTSLLEGLGMTEAYPISYSKRDEMPTGSCGKPVDELFEVTLVDPETDEPVETGQPGEITLRPRHSWTMMQGYVGMPDKTVEAWRNLRFHTGDIAYFDETGHLHFLDRASDRIRRRAENISSYDIEEAARSHAAVAECAAVGVPSGYADDDDIKLCVVPTPGQSQLDPVSLIEHLVDSLPHYMVPRYIEVLDSLPRTPTNKVQKHHLRARAVDQHVWDRKAAGVSVREVSGQRERRLTTD